ncbi:MAG: hypothetical protein MUF38_06795 [Anaerolineae bacterium]|nr:hypothetical protein [Anaerolineae bacterium]
MTRLTLTAALLFALAACSPAPVPQPTPTFEPEPTLDITAVATSTPTTAPTIGPSIEPPTATASPVPTDDGLIPATLNPTVLTELEAPVRIDIPDGWQVASDALLLPAAEGMRAVPFSLYRGPVPGGTGTVLLLWGFENVVPAAPTGGVLAPINLFADGLRMLMFTVVEAECNFAYDEERIFSVGGMQGQGTYFAADDCPDELPSLRGWFTAVNPNGLNFAFYAYTEPMEAFDGASDQLQTILDSVELDLSLLPTAAPTEPPLIIITLTPDPQAPTSTPAAAPSTTPGVVFATATPAP